VRLFEGYEAEGRYRGIKTLFVSGDVPWENIEKELLNKVYFYSQVYFGADGCSEVNWDSVDNAIVCSGVDIVSVEIGSRNVFSKLPLSSKLHLVINLDRLTRHNLEDVLSAIQLPKQVQIKFDTTSKSCLAPYIAFMCNNHEDINSDKEIWRK
jgi:hypothetical protein